jgi:tryptophan-rich sensory protein
MYAIPSALLLAITVVLAVGVTCGGLMAVHRRFRADVFLPHNEVAGFIISVVGTLYAVVLGFVTVVVWQQYDATKERLALETASVTDTWHAAVGFPQDVRTRLRADMMSYATSMIDNEWPLMRAGRFSVRGDELIMDAIDTAGSYVPANSSEANAQSATLRILTDLHDARLRRLANNQSGVSWFEWAVLIVGAVVVIVFCYLFGLKNRRVHLAMTGCVAVLVATLFVMIFELQYPFRGDLGISSHDWTLTLQHMRYMQSMSMRGMRM